MEQVNVLKTNLRNHTNKIKLKADQLHNQMEQLEATVKQQDLPYEGIARCAAEISALDQQLKMINEEGSAFESMYNHLLAWQRLVGDGSQLLDLIQQMGHIASDHQDRFDQLSRDIKADISSKANKLEALPSHSVYAVPLDNLHNEVKKMRQLAQDEFVNLQARYYQTLNTKGSYSRERIGRPFEYNASNPEESYRLLYERVQNLTAELLQQVAKILRERRQDATNILNTPLFKSLVASDQSDVKQTGEELIGLANDCLSSLSQLEKSVEDISVIRDFPSDNNGRFCHVIDELYNASQLAKDLTVRGKQLSQWLTEISLTPEEDRALLYLRSEDLETETDIQDWLSSSKMSDDEFWNVMRSLHAKHRIRVLVTRIRR